ncbi:FMN-binding protein [Gracilinema caldarium]|uniref:FMN-binding protein n=1 Tax=Gracilinema caldarium TaxID=215591 RepID=UPI0026F2034D|nr:FMN-binding protein [Gracilinema caldarium]
MILTKQPWAVLLAVIFSLTLGSCNFMEEFDNIEIVDPDLSKTADGTWIGAWNTTLVKVQVSVDTADHRISQITILRHDCGRGKPAEAIVDRVVEAQSLKVDAVSGATGSSRVILRAIQDALEKATAEKMETP